MSPQAGRQLCWRDGRGQAAPSSLYEPAPPLKRAPQAVAFVATLFPLSAFYLLAWWGVKMLYFFESSKTIGPNAAGFFPFFSICGSVKGTDTGAEHCTRFLPLLLQVRPFCYVPPFHSRGCAALLPRTSHDLLMSYTCIFFVFDPFSLVLMGGALSLTVFSLPRKL